MVSRSLSSISGRGERRPAPREQLLVVEPAVARAFERDEVLDVGNLVADAVDGVQVVGVRAHDPRAAVVDDVREVVGDQAVVDRHEHRADLRHGVERLELRVGVRRDVRDAIALPTPSRCSAADQRSQRSKNWAYVRRRSPSTTASRSAYSRRARRMNSSGVSGVSMAVPSSRDAAISPAPAAHQTDLLVAVILACPPLKLSPRRGEG